MPEPLGTSNSAAPSVAAIVAPAVTLTINGASLSVAPGTTVAAAILISGSFTRASISGAPRAPLCGMGICFECRAAINGVTQQRSCQVLCEAGMDVRTP